MKKVKTDTSRLAAIINADDFGLSPGICEGIIRAANEGVLTSTTLQANLPGAEAGVKMLKDAPLLGVGVHLTISAGHPLSEQGKALASEESGRMTLSAERTYWELLKHPRLLDAAEAEFDAQIRWTLDHGITPDHLDSHKHSHAYPPLFSRVVKLARKYKIPFIRQYGEKWPSPKFPPHNPDNRKAHYLLNFLGWINATRYPKFRGTLGTCGVLHTGLICPEYFICAAKVLARRSSGVMEFMTHPGNIYDLTPEMTRMRNSRPRELATLTNPAVREAFDSLGIKLINYRQLADFLKRTGV